MKGTDVREADFDVEDFALNLGYISKRCVTFVDKVKNRRSDCVFARTQTLDLF